jgi:hypothetical protein
MVHNTKGHGRKISSMAMEKKYGQMGHVLRVNIQKAKKVEKVTLCGQMEALIKVIFMIIIYMEEAYIDGLMDVFMMGLGKTIKCMEMVYLLGLMVVDMTESTLKIKRKGEAYFSGQTEESTMEDGSMGNSMGKAIIFQ